MWSWPRWPCCIQGESETMIDLFRCTYTLCHVDHFSKISYLFFIYPFLTLLHWESNTILNHKIYDPWLIFSLDELNEWRIPWLFLLRFSIMWLPSFILMAGGVALYIFPLHIINSNFLLCMNISEVGLHYLIKFVIA